MLFGIQIKLMLAGAALAVVAGAYGTGYYNGRADGRASQLKATVKAYETRNGIDESVSGLATQQLCVELGGLSDECAELRGVDETSEAK